MKHGILAACGVLAVAGTVTVSAQTPTSPPRPAPSTPTMSKPDAGDKTITVTGCLKSWDSSMGTPPAGTGGTAYVLTNVETDSTMAKKPESATARTDATASQYIVTAASSVNLAAHLNHKVRLSGTTSKMADHSGAATTPRSEPAKPGEPASPAMDRTSADKAHPKLNVTSVTMISATCPAQSQ